MQICYAFQPLGCCCRVGSASGSAGREHRYAGHNRHCARDQQRAPMEQICHASHRWGVPRRQAPPAAARLKGRPPRRSRRHCARDRQGANGSYSFIACSSSRAPSHGAHWYICHASRPSGVLPQCEGRGQPVAARQRLRCHARTPPLCPRPAARRWSTVVSPTFHPECKALRARYLRQNSFRSKYPKKRRIFDQQIVVLLCGYVTLASN
jgi:hypothetical protein